MSHLIACIGVTFGVLLSSSELVSAQDSANGEAAAVEQEQSKADNPQFIAGNWTVNCQAPHDGKDLDCVLSQTIFTAQNQDVFIAFSIRPTPDNFLPEPYLGVLRLPHGLALDAGIEYQIDAQNPGQMTVSTSSPQGAFARVGLSEELIAGLKRGHKLEFAFSSRNGQRFFIPMSLVGISAGFEKIQ